MNLSLVDAVSSLFYSEYVDAIASEAVRDTLSLSTSNGAVIAHYAANRTAGTTSGTRSLVKLAAMVSKMAGFGFTPFGQTASGSPLLVRGQDAEAILRRAELVLQSRSDPPVAAAWRGSSQSAVGVPAALAEEELMRSLLAAAGADAQGTGAPQQRDRGRLYPPGPAPAWVGGAGLGWAPEGASAPLTSSGPVGGTNASSASDGSVATSLLLAWPGTQGSAGPEPVWVRLAAAPACPRVRGVRVWLPAPEDRAGRAPVRVEVQAAAEGTASGGAAGWQAVAAGQLTSPGQGWAELQWQSSFAAPQWRVVVTQAENAPASSPRAGALELAELQLLASGGAATPCDAEALAAAADDSSPTLPKGRLMVRLYPGTSPVQRSRVVNSLRNRMPDDSFRVEDTAALLTAAATAIQGLDAFFYVVAVVCLVLCFFAVWLSFAANIRENSREVGILRSLGLTKPNVRLLVAAEALSVVSAAFLSGSVIGMAISVSLSLQFNLFTQLPFVFRFPTGMFVGTLVLCVVVAVAGSLLPLRRFLQLEIAPVAKGRA